MYEENGEKLEIILVTKLCHCFRQLSERTNERPCVNLLRTLESIFSLPTFLS